MDGMSRIGIRLISAGTRHAPLKKTFDQFGRRTASHFVIAYISAGTGSYASASQRRTAVGAGDILVCFPGTWHQYGPEAGSPWSEYWIAIDGPIPDGYRVSGVFDSARPVQHIGNDISLIHDWERCIASDSAHASPADRASALGALILRIAVLTGRQYPGDSKRSAVERIVRAMKTKVRGREFDFRRSCAASGFGYSYARKLFKRYTGFAPDEYFRRLKIAAARDALLKSDEKVYLIAERFGFRDQYYFTRLFRRSEGVSPREYRRLNDR